MTRLEILECPIFELNRSWKKMLNASEKGGRDMALSSKEAHRAREGISTRNTKHGLL